MNASLHRLRLYRALPLAPKLMAAALIVGALAAGAQAQNLIKNGGFETGNFSDWSVIPASSGTDFGVGNAAGYFFQVGNGGTLNGAPVSTIPFAGTYAAYFGAVNKAFDTIEQSLHTVSTSAVKGVYQISFHLAYLADPTGGPGPGAFQVLWGGHAVYSRADNSLLSYQHVVLNETAAGTNSTLGFQGYAVPPFYFLDNVSVTLAQLDFNFSKLTPNQRGVARAIENAGYDTRLMPAFNYITATGGRDILGDLDRIAPEELTSIFSISTAYATEQSLNLQRRTDDIRSGSSGFSAAGLAINGAGPSYSGGFNIGTGVAGPNGNDGKEVKETKEVAPAENRWGAFLSGTGEWVNVTSTANAHGYELANGGFTMGVDYKVCPNFAIGLAAGYLGGTANLVNNGSVLVNGGKLGLYATTFKGGWYADAAAFGGYNGYDTRRSALGGDASGSTHGGEVDALFGTGYDFKAGGLTFGPTATFNYTYSGIKGFTENGSVLPLDIHGGDGESLRSAFGFKVSCETKCGGCTLKPELRAAWQHEFGDKAYSLDSSFANGAGSTFTVTGPELGRDSVLLGGGFAVLVNDRTSVYLYYDGELGKTNYLSTSVTGGVRLAF